jgi:hypothetical protein
MDKLKIKLRQIYKEYNGDENIFGESDCQYLISQLMNELKAHLKYRVIQELYDKNLVLLSEYQGKCLYKGLFYNLLKDIKRIIEG